MSATDARAIVTCFRRALGPKVACVPRWAVCSVLVVASTLSAWQVVHAQDAEGTTHPGHLVPMFPAATDEVRQGFVRVINHSGRSGEVEIRAIDDAGTGFGPTTLAIDADETVHFNSTDLEQGNAAKGLPDGVGSGSGDWWLTLESGLDIEVLSYIRTPQDGFLTSMHDLVPAGEENAYRVAVFNPGRNLDQLSRLRLINPGSAPARVTIAGIDDNGESASGEVRVTVAAGAARTLDAQELEGGGAGFEGSLGGGAGKWQLVVGADGPVHVMSLLSSPTGHLTNLSTAPENVADNVHTVAMFPAASDPLGRQGFVRVINHSDRAGRVTVDAFDDTDREFGSSTLALDAGETVHFNSDDLEMGNAAKGLTGGSGAGDGDWRLTLSSSLDIEVLAYIRTTTDGFLTAMHDAVPREGQRHRVATFNPGSNVDQVSRLRLVNAGGRAADVTVTGIDDGGERSSGSVSVSVPEGASRTLTAQELEAGGAGFVGELGDGAGKWQLVVESARPVVVMSLLSSPTGHLTNLSTAPALDFAPGDSTVFDDRVDGRRVVGDDPTGYVDFLADGRFRETLGTQTYEGGYTYNRTGRNRGTVVFDYDDGDRCSSELTFRSRTAGSLTFSCDEGESGTSGWHIADAPSGGDAGDAYCRSGATIAAGDSCTIYSTDFTFEVEASGRSCLRAGGFTSCSGNRQNFPNTTINGITITLVAASNPDGSWTIEDAAPVPPGGAAGGPDLVVSSAAATDNSLAPAAAFAVSAVVRNAGDRTSPATTLRYYRSPNANISTGDAVVGSDAVGALAAGAESEKSTALTAPDEPGTYYYGACAGVVAGESRRANNCSDAVTVTVTDGDSDAPDLVVESPSVSDPNPAAGALFTLSAVVRNTGAGDAPVTTLRYYRSNDAAISGSDAEVGMQAITGLAAGSRAEHSTSIAAPAAAGTYYYGACVEPVSDESDSRNNCSEAVEVVVGDGVGGGFELDGANGNPAGAVYANGGLYVADVLDDKVYVYASAGRDSRQDFDLDGQNGRAVGITFANGRLWVVDRGENKVFAYDLAGGRDQASDFELDGDNRYAGYIAHADGRVYVGDGFDDKFYGYRLSGERDAALDFDLHSENRDISGVVYADDRFYVVDDRDDRVFAYRKGGERAAASEFDLAGDNSRPAGIAYNGGRLYVVNTFPYRVFVYNPEAPDLVVESVSASDEAPELGAAFTLSATVANRGRSRSPASTLRYLRSDDDRISADDSEVGSDAVAALGAAGSRTFSITLTAPSSAGRYFYGACVDGLVDELDIGNNCSSAVRVSVAGPDLVVRSLATSDQTPDVDSSLTLSVTVRNTGERASSATTLRYYRSTNRTVSSDDTEVGAEAVAALAAGAEAEHAISVTAPSSTGTWYYGACVDPVAGEPDPPNNCTPFGALVRVGDDGAEAFDLVGDNGSPDGIAYADGRFYVVDGADRMVYAYGGDGQRAAAGDFELDADNAAPGGVVFTQGRLHVVDLWDDKVYVYRSGGERVSTRDFDLDFQNGNPTGIVDDGTGLFVLDWRDGRVYAYGSNGERDTASDFGLDAANANADGLAYVGDRFYVGDVGDDRIYAYWFNGRRAPESDIELHADNGLLRGLAYANGMLYAVDETDEEVYAYAPVPEPDAADLIVRSPSTSDATPEAGASYTFSATAHNRGSRSSPAGTVRYYRSTDAGITPDDTELASDSLDSLSASASASLSARVTAPDEDGCYFCGACVDAVDGEGATANNCSRPVEVLIGERADLDITSAALHRPFLAIIGRSSIRLSVTVTNTGLGRSRPAKVVFTGGEVHDIPALAPQEETTLEEVWVGYAQLGTSYYTACVADVPCEENTANNCRSRSVTYQ